MGDFSKELKKLRKELERQGWTFRPTKKGEFAVPPDPSKELVLIHLTPSDRRAWANMLRDLKRSGFDA